MSEEKTEATAEEIKAEVDFFVAEIYKLVNERRKTITFGRCIDRLVESRLFTFLHSQQSLKCEMWLQAYEQMMIEISENNKTNPLGQ